jgi:glycosyltransferase involved in cell wall biosynthesis
VRSIDFIVPGSLAGRSGGYEYDRRIIQGLRSRGWSVQVHEIAGSFPIAGERSVAEARDLLSTIADAAILIVDGLAVGAIASEIERESSRLRMVPLVHMPLAADMTLDAATLKQFEENERRAVLASTAVVVTGKATVETMVRYGMPRDRIAVVEPGTARAPLARGSADENVHFVSVAAITREKGHDVAFRALASVPHRNWRITCAGSVERDRAFVDQLRAIAAHSGIADRVTLTGELDDEALSTVYDEADVFVLATLHETYGMAVAEALARGLPIVSTTVGAIRDLVGDEAGLLVSPGDERALARALTSVIQDRAVRERLTAGARRVRERLPRWEDAVDRMIGVLTRVSSNERGAF